MIEAETVIFATDASEAGICAARDWIKAQNMGGDDCRLIKRKTGEHEQCLVISKRPLNDLKRTS